jgi:hypothetical protein
MKPVGYLINTDVGQTGEPGFFYDYVLAKNGLFIQASGPLLRARISVVEAEIRGLDPLEEYFELVKGKIPHYIYDLAISVLCADSTQEKYLAVTWDGQYGLKSPEQVREPAKVTYELQASTILDIHSHGAGKPLFSPIDDSDEKGLRLSMVVGHVDTLMPEEAIRVGVYGYYAPIDASGVFDV